MKYPIAELEQVRAVVERLHSWIPHSIGDVVSALIRRKRHFAIPFLAVLILFAALLPLVPRRYTATAIVAVTDQKFLPSLGPKNPSRPRNSGAASNVKRLVMELLGGQDLLQLADQLGIRRDAPADNSKAALRQMSKQIEVTAPEEGILQVSFQHEDPVMAQRGANATARQIALIDTRRETEQAQNAVPFLEKELKAHQEKMERADRESVALELDQRIGELERKRAAAAAPLSAMRMATNAAIGNDDPGRLRIKAELSEERAKLNQMLLSARPESPFVQEQQQKVDQLEALVELADEEAAAGGAASVDPAYASAAREVKRMDVEIQTLRRQRAALPADAGERTGGGQTTAAEGAANEETYQSLLKALESARLAEQTSQVNPTGPFRVIEAAELPQTPSWPNPLQGWGVALILAVIAGLCSVFYAEARDTSFRTADEAAADLQLPLLGSIPRIQLRERRRVERIVRRPSTIAPQVVLLREPESFASEQFRLLRTQLLTFCQSTSCRVIMVTSAVSGEGKTTTCVNLALSMAAELDKKVLLMDCDVRQSSIAHILGVSARPGMFDYLTGAESVEDAIRTYPRRSISLLTAGEPVDNPARWLASEKMSTLMDEVRARFDLVIMDAPPVLPLADAGLLAAYADGIVLAVEANRTPRSLVAQAKSRLEKLKKAPFLGCVLTRAPEELSGAYASVYYNPRNNGLDTENPRT